MNEKESKFEFTLDIQRKIVAMLIREERAFKENFDLVKPEFFDNPALKDMVTLITGFFKKYSKIPKDVEFLEELDSFLDKNKKLPSDEYCDVAEKIIILSKQDDFKHVKDKVIDFVRFQAMKKAILEAGKNKLAKRDFEGIIRDINEAANLGSFEGELRCLADIEAEKVKWLWEDRIPVGKLSLLVGDPGAGKSFFTIFLPLKFQRVELGSIV